MGLSSKTLKEALVVMEERLEKKREQLREWNNRPHLDDIESRAYAMFADEVGKLQVTVNHQKDLIKEAERREAYMAKIRQEAIEQVRRKQDFMDPFSIEF